MLGSGGQVAGPDVDFAERVGAQTGHPASLLHRRMRLPGRVDGVPAIIGSHPTSLGRTAADPVERRDQSDECRIRRAGLDHPAARTATAVGGAELGRQVEQLGQPVQDEHLELGRRRRGRPQHALDAQTGREQITQDGRAGRIGREVGEEGWMLPVGDAGQDHPVEVGQHLGEVLAVLRWAGRQGPVDLAGGHLGQHRQLADPLLVVRDPVHRRVPVGPELLGSHVTAHGMRTYAICRCSGVAVRCGVLVQGTKPGAGQGLHHVTCPAFRPSTSTGSRLAQPKSDRGFGGIDWASIVLLKAPVVERYTRWTQNPLPQGVSVRIRPGVPIVIVLSPGAHRMRCRSG